MNALPIHTFSNFSLQFCSESLDTLLTPQNKKIALIAMIAFTCLTALFVLADCCCREELGLLIPEEKFEYPDGTEGVGKFYIDNKYDNRFRGKQTDFDGITEEGTFLGYRSGNQKMELDGQGKRTYLDGSVWEGDFDNGHLNGKGKKILANGTIEEGNFKRDLLNGKGKVTIPKGDTIEGFFKDGKLNGFGKITHPDGTVEEGLFENGVLTRKRPKFNQATTTANAPTASTKKADAFASSPEE
jgi:hypothetical protein